MKSLRVWFVAGIVVLLPLVATITALRTLLRWADGILQPLAIQFLGLRIPGFGALLLFLVLVLAGLGASHVLSRRVFSIGNKALRLFPLTGSLYRAAQEMVGALFSPANQTFRRVILFEYPRRGIYTLGFVTSTLTVKDDPYVTIFVPSTPNPMFGWTVMAPSHEVEPLPYTTENTLMYIISLGLVSLKATDLSAAHKSS